MCSYITGDEGACADFGEGSGSDLGCAMYHTACVDDESTSNVAVNSFPCKSASGQSGSPVWLYYASTGKRVVNGVFTSDNTDESFFTIMSKTVFNELQTYIADMRA